MYSMFSSCIFAMLSRYWRTVCAHTSPSQNDDEFEKYEPRPKIVIDKRDFESPRFYKCDSPEPTTPSLRISAQHVHQKDAVIVKILSLHGCDLLTDEASQV
ncbi:hypothetical protein COOONC_19337 [Cooperia oncophora]